MCTSATSLPARLLLGSLVLAAIISVAPPTSLEAQAREARFVLLIGGDTLATERFVRTPDRMEGELTGGMIGRLTYEHRLAPDGSTASIDIRMWTPGSTPAGEPAQAATLTIRGDSVMAEIVTAAGRRIQRLATRGAPTVHVNPSFAVLELAAIRARAAGGERVDIPILLAVEGQTIDASFSWSTPEEFTVTIAGLEMRGHLAADGRLLSGSVPAQNLTFTRVE